MDILDALRELKKGNKVISSDGLIYELQEGKLVFTGGLSYKDESSLNNTSLQNLLLYKITFELYEEPIVLKAGDKYCYDDSFSVCFELVSNKDETMWGLCSDYSVAVKFLETQQMQEYLKSHGYKKVT